MVIKKICKECGEGLITSTFRDRDGEVTGWVTECIGCDIIYMEE